MKSTNYYEKIMSFCFILQGDDPPVLLPETNTSISSSSPTVNFSHSEKCEAECSKVKTSEQRFWSSSEWFVFYNYCKLKFLFYFNVLKNCTK